MEERLSATMRVATYAPAVLMIPLLILLGAGYIDEFSHDGVYYLRLAHYYREGNYSLALSGLWSPLFPWLIWAGSMVFDNLIQAAHLAAGLSAWLFWLGTTLVCRNLGLRDIDLLLASGVAMAFGLVWAELLTPDILVAGLLALGLAVALARTWISGRFCPTLSGVLLALAYLSKAVALPISVMLLLLVAARSLRLGNDFGRVAMATVYTAIGFAVVALPWVVALSAHHERPTFSNSGAINHAIRGPSPGNRNLYQIIENVQPEAGRISAFEDPSNLNYRQWSPFANLEYFKFQLRKAYWNSYTALSLLRRMDLLGLGLAGLLIGLVCVAAGGRQLEQPPWQWSAFFVAAVVMFYVPVWASEFRYYFPVYPLCLAAALAAFRLLSTLLDLGAGRRAAVAAVVALSFFAAIGPGSRDLIREREQYRAGRALSEVVAGMPAVRTLWVDGTAYEAGVFAAFLLDIPVILLPEAASERTIPRPAESVVVTARGAADDESAAPRWRPGGFSAASSVALDEKHVLEIWTPGTR